MSTGIREDDVFKGGAVVDPCVGIGGEVESEVGEVVFLFDADGRTGFEVESVAFVKNLGVLENLNVAVQRFALDLCAVLMERFEDVRKARRRAEIVDKIYLNLLEYGTVSDFYTAFDVFFKYLGDNAVYVCPAIFCRIILNGFGKSAFAQVPVEFFHEVVGDIFPEECFHAEIFVEG